MRVRYIKHLTPLTAASNVVGAMGETWAPKVGCRPTTGGTKFTARSARILQARNALDAMMWRWLRPALPKPPVFIACEAVLFLKVAFRLIRTMCTARLRKRKRSKDTPESRDYLICVAHCKWGHHYKCVFVLATGASLLPNYRGRPNLLPPINLKQIQGHVLQH